jgi:hypothetical protein
LKSLFIESFETQTITCENHSMRLRGIYKAFRLGRITIVLSFIWLSPYHNRIHKNKMEQMALQKEKQRQRFEAWRKLKEQEAAVALPSV